MRATGLSVASDNQSALITHQATVMGFSPTGVPEDLPNFRALVSVFDSVALRPLIVECRRVLAEVLNLNWLFITTFQSRVILRPSSLIFRRFSQYFRLAQPDMSIRWYPANERFASSLVQSVKELAVASVELSNAQASSRIPLGIAGPLCTRRRDKNHRHSTRRRTRRRITADQPSGARPVSSITTPSK